MRNEAWLGFVGGTERGKFTCGDRTTFILLTKNQLSCQYVDYGRLVQFLQRDSRKNRQLKSGGAGVDLQFRP
jgi:hypothetical protein